MRRSIRCGRPVAVGLATAAFAMVLFAGSAGAGEDEARAKVREEGEKAGAVLDITAAEHIGAGADLYKSNCTWYCHGPEGAKGRSRTLRGRPDLSARDISLVINNGLKRAGKIMPAWKARLTPEQVWQLVAYLVSLRDVED